MVPMSVTYSRVAQLDHHCAVAFIGAWLLLILVKLVAGTGSPYRQGIALSLAQIAMLLTWHGSLLYLGVAQAILWVGAALCGRRSLYAVQAGSALATLCVITPVVWLFPDPLAGQYSAIALSRLHVLAVAAAALVSSAVWWLERPGERARSRSAAQRLAWTGCLGLAVAAILFSLPGLREGLDPALLEAFHVVAEEESRLVVDCVGVPKDVDARLAALERAGVIEKVIAFSVAV